MNNLKTRVAKLETKGVQQNGASVIFLHEGDELPESNNAPCMIVPIFKDWEASTANLQDALTTACTQ